MFLGKVVGTVWSTVKWPQLTGLKLLLVRPYDLAGLQSGEQRNEHEAVVCADLLDAGVGDDVIIAYGHAARVAAYSTGIGASPPATGAPPVPIDAAVVAVVDRFQVEPPAS